MAVSSTAIFQSSRGITLVHRSTRPITTLSIDYCESKGWRWEPQAPQMPHMNNLDLAVFPKMSKDHSSLLQNYSNKMPPAHEIWISAQAVWRSMDSACIARGFILAYRIAQKVIDNASTNTFLQTQDFHSGVRAE
jgi:hypothetical protein